MCIVSYCIGVEKHRLRSLYALLVTRFIMYVYLYTCIKSEEPWVK